MIFQNQEQLDAAVAKWQKILRLQDWDVKVSIQPSTVMDTKKGSCHWWAETRIAIIKLLDPKDYRSCAAEWEDFDQEHTLVHELLHITMAPLEVALGYRSDNDWCEQAAVACEVIINQTASALVKLSRAADTRAEIAGDNKIVVMGIGSSNGKHEIPSKSVKTEV